jgi:hypothetical protein
MILLTFSGTNIIFSLFNSLAEHWLSVSLIDFSPRTIQYRLKTIHGELISGIKEGLRNVQK